jgi:hypothetical protein
MTAAGGLATAMGVGSKGGSQDGGVGGQLVEAVLEHAEDEGGMVGDAHGRTGNKGRIGEGVDRFSGKRAKSQGERKKEPPEDRTPPPRGLFIRSETGLGGAS